MVELKKLFAVGLTAFLCNTSCFASEFTKEINVKTGDIWRLKGVKAEYQVSNTELASCEHNGVVMLRSGDVVITARVYMQDGSTKTLQYLAHIAKGEGVLAIPAKEVPVNFQIDVICFVNNERAKYGLKPLHYNEELDKACQIRAKEIAQQFSHTRPDGTDVFSLVSDTGNIMGENIAAGQATAETAVVSWMNSPKHRENILKPDYKETAVGCYYDTNGTERCRLYWVQLFRG